MTLTNFVIFLFQLVPRLIIHNMDLLMNMCFTSQNPPATSVRNPYVTEQHKLQSKPSAGKMVSPKYSNRSYVSSLPPLLSEIFHTSQAISVCRSAPSNNGQPLLVLLELYT